MTTTDKTLRLPNALTIALGEYFVRRGEAREQVSCTRISSDGTTTKEYSPAKHWDKTGLLEKISKSLPKGWGYRACAGTFLFSRSGCKNCYKIDETSWPLAFVLIPDKKS